MSQDLVFVNASMHISKAVQDPKTGEMRWQSTSSDTLPDGYEDEMTLELYKSFIDRIESRQPVPEAYRSSFWQGGMPYVSLSHYSDANGKNVPGMPTAVYIDGNKLKARGVMNDTPLGRACFKALQETIQRSIQAPSPVRVSIGFLDYQHQHKWSGTTFTRKSIDEVCPECEQRLAQEGKVRGLRFLDGHLIHLALTRVPVNPRTLMEIDKSMPTQKEDAASIVGEELVEEVEKAELDGNTQKALVTKSEEPVAVPTLTEPVTVVNTSTSPVVANSVWVPDNSQVLARLDALEETLKSLLVPEVHPLDGVIAEFKSAFDSADRSSVENLQVLTPSWEKFADSVKRSFGVEGPGDKSPSVADMVKSEIQAAIQPTLDSLLVIAEQLKSQAQPAVNGSATVQRGLTSVPLVVNDPARIARSQGEQAQPLSLRDRVRLSVGLQPEAKTN